MSIRNIVDRALAKVDEAQMEERDRQEACPYCHRIVHLEGCPGSIDSKLEWARAVEESARVAEEAKKTTPKIVGSPWSIALDLLESGLDARAICYSIDSLVEAQNETNRLLGIMIKKAK